MEGKGKMLEWTGERKEDYMNIKELIEKKESETLEFKKSTAQLEKALRSICAFLNHRGGNNLFWS